jgi:hypothetical protein
LIVLSLVGNLAAAIKMAQIGREKNARGIKYRLFRNRKSRAIPSNLPQTLPTVGSASPAAVSWLTKFGVKRTSGLSTRNQSAADNPIA